MKLIKILILSLIVLTSCNTKETYTLVSKVPDLEMPNNQLKFKEIEDYKNYKIVGTHYRTDKNELRYILANPIAFKAYNEKTAFPNGSKIVKIGWTVEKMSNFNPALEAKKVQRIEYMIKDKTRFAANPGNWGYARFVKVENSYEPWQKGTKGCVSCHNLAIDNDYLFTKLQALD